MAHGSKASGPVRFSQTFGTPPDVSKGSSVEFVPADAVSNILTTAGLILHDEIWQVPHLVNPEFLVPEHSQRSRRTLGCRACIKHDVYYSAKYHIVSRTLEPINDRPSFLWRHFPLPLPSSRFWRRDLTEHASLASSGSLSGGWMVLNVHFEHLRRLQQQDDGKGFRYKWMSKSYCSKLSFPAKMKFASFIKIASLRLAEHRRQVGVPYSILLVPIPAYGEDSNVNARDSLTDFVRPYSTSLRAGRQARCQGQYCNHDTDGSTWLQKAQSDILAQFPTGHEALERIRLVSLFDSTQTDLFALIPKLIEAYPPRTKLSSAEAPSPVRARESFSAVPPPTAVILDMFALPQLHAMRSISGTTVPIFMFVAGSAGALFARSALRRLVGKATLAHRSMPRHYALEDGSVIKIPGLPTMYDYEAFPQHATGVRRGIRYDYPAYDEESLVAFQTWARQTLHKPVYAIGPLLPPEYGKEKTPISTGTSDVEISFGSVFWPKVDTQLEDLVEALLEKEMPFILCYASPLAVVPDALSEKIKSSGIGMATTWAPQQYILTHPATGWFLTHCGHGGVTESLASGVPMCDFFLHPKSGDSNSADRICWPFQADQPFAAAHLSENLNVAFHLMEVRTAKGLLPLHNGRVPRGTREAAGAEFREIVDLCRGEVGMEKRKNALRMRAEFVGAWAAGGSSMMALNEFFAKYIPIP
ncbi:hypothetical protein B0H13DRAFT_2558393 [Mycena leptocephala]|nr:hypothetical protein B0H13DRAFT_2558393 [Mycena leptocephala]